MELHGRSVETLIVLPLVLVFGLDQTVVNNQPFALMQLCLSRLVCPLDQ